MIEYTKIDKGTISPDHEDAVALMEADSWTRFAAGALADNSCESVERAAEIADWMMLEFRKRFIHNLAQKDQEEQRKEERQ